MSTDQKRARWFGVLYLITFATSIPALLLFQPVLDDPAGYIAGAGHDNRIFLAAFLELLLIIANIGTAVVPYALFRRYSPRLALGFVTARLVESGFIAVGIVSVLAYMSLRQDPAGISDGTLVGLGQSLVAVHDATFLLGPGFVVGVGNGLILGYLMYKSGLLPRRMAWFGLIGGPVLFISSVGTLVEWWDAGSTVPSLLVVPEIIWEAFLGIYCAIWGFRKDSPIVRPNWRGSTTAA
jgi:uncharacterized protein DUF4386